MNFLTSEAIIAGILSAPWTSGNAYLDPGSGSFILQLLIATLVGALFAIKVYWKKITTFFQKLFSRRNNDQDE